MKALIACEESQAVCKALREKGVEAYSCDLLEPSGGKPEWHLQTDVIPLLNHDWDLIIAFPPCTHLSSSGARYFAEKRKDGRQQKAVDFFMQFTRVQCEKVAIENPIGIMSTLWRKPDQIIHPYQFGHGVRKSTCLWLKGLPLLQSTHLVAGRDKTLSNMAPSPERAKMRSKTFQGIAEAMAEQWQSGVEYT